MGEFDDVLAIEPGDDWAAWDEWAAGESARAPVELAPLAAELRLPHARVHLRGAVPAEVLDTFADLADPSLEVGDESPLVTLTFDELDDGAVSIVDLEHGEVGRGADPVELTASLATTLAELADRTDPERLHLAAATIEVGGTDEPRCGVILVDPDRTTRHAAVAAALTSGARLLSADRVVVLPGSRTVFAEPLPLELSNGWTRASTLGATRPCTTVGAVVFLERRPGQESVVQRLSSAEGCARLVEHTGALEQFGSAALDVLAPLAAGASFWVLSHDDPDDAGRMICGSRSPVVREVVTVSRVAPAGAGTVGAAERRGRAPESTRDERHSDAVRAGRSATRMARFDSGAVLVDGGEQRIEVIGDDRADELERQLGNRGVTDPARLFGLPDTPRQRPSDPAADAAEVTTAAGAPAVLARVVELLDPLDSDPVVLGDLVQAHDGALPAAAWPVDRIDLLVDRAAVTAVAESLEGAGFDLAPHPLGVVEGGSSVEWRSPNDGVLVGLHWQLAVGPFGELVDHDELSRRSVPIRIDRQWYRALHPEDRFVLACVRVAGSSEPTAQQLRAVVFTAPRDELLMASALEASERWGATRTVTQAIRTVDAALPGLSPWLVARSRPGASGVGVDDGRRRRRRFGQGRRKSG